MAAAAANSLDNILDEPYFRELAIVKEPALQLKAFIERINNNITIGPKWPEKTEPESSSKIIAKYKEYEELSKFKSLLVKTSEFTSVFDEIKKERSPWADILSEIRLEIDKKKKKKKGMGADCPRANNKNKTWLYI